MGTSVRRAYGAALLGLIVVAATGGAFVLTDDGPAGSGRDRAGRSAPSNSHAHWPDVDASVVMRPTPQRDLVFTLPENTFLSVWDPKTGKHREPRRVGGDHYNVPHKDRTQVARGRKVFYVADDQGVIVDVVVFSNARGGSGRLDPQQWVISKDGVQLIWNRKKKAPWSVLRGEKQLASDAPGIYFDPTSSSKSSYYTMEHVEDVTFLGLDGEPTKGEKSTTYVAIVPGYDERLIGTNVNELGQQSDPGLILKHSAVSTVDETSNDVVAFVEWNSFISDEYVGATLCGVGPSDIWHFGGDGRTWSTI